MFKRPVHRSRRHSPMPSSSVGTEGPMPRYHQHLRRDRSGDEGKGDGALRCCRARTGSPLEGEQGADGLPGDALIEGDYVAKIRRVLMSSRTIWTLRHIIRNATYQKNDANDAGAIVEAAQRPTMRFVAVKTEEEQARSVVFRARELLVHQRTQTINAPRGHLAEFGLVVPLGTHNVGRLEEAFAECEECFPALAPPAIRLLIERIHDLDAEIDEMDREIRRIVREDEALRRLMTIPGVGELTAMAVHAYAPPMENFRKGRDFAGHGSGSRRVNRRRVAGSAWGGSRKWVSAISGGSCTWGPRRSSGVRSGGGRSPIPGFGVCWTRSRGR